MPELSWANYDEFHFFNSNYWCSISLKNKRVVASIALPENAENRKLCFAQKTIAFTLGNNLYLIGTNNVPNTNLDWTFCRSPLSGRSINQPRLVL